MNNRCFYRILTSVIFISFLSTSVKAQNYEFPLLERLVTINAENKTIESILDDISHQAGFIFSYNPDVINAYSVVTYKAENKTVRFVLSDILDRSIAFRETGSYVILQSEKGFREKRMLEGYLYDSRTGERISNASIYDKNLMRSAVTNRYGYFSLELSPLSDSTSFNVCKSGYADTSIIKTSFNKSNRLLELMMNKTERGADSIRSKFPVRVPAWLVPKNIWANSINIRESWSRAVQISLVPGIGTNRLLGGNIENRFSLNIIGGYTKSVGIMEAGGVFNVVQDDAGFCQIGGVCNFVGGTSRGAQISGVYNSASTVKGTQVAGVVNISRGSSDVQVSGVINSASDSKIQLAGVANYVPHSSDVQVSGLVNIADSSLVQITGLVNISGYSKIVQAGVVNISGNSKGLQAGLVNIADSSWGVKVGLVNISKNSDGVYIGLINYVKNGYHCVEISSDEILFENLAFRTGTRSFHSIVSIGARPFGNRKGVWGAGYGIGTSFGKSDKTFYDIEATATELFYGRGLRTDCQVYRLYAGTGGEISDHLSVAAGLTFNLMVVNWPDAKYGDVFLSLPPYSVHLLNDTNANRFASWVGVKVALRFF